MRAALTKNIDERGRTPYQKSASTPCYNTDACLLTGFDTVPAGKRLVVEYVNAEIIHQNNQYNVLWGALFSSGASSQSFRLPTRPTANSSWHHISEPVRMYFEPNSTLAFIVDVDGSFGSGDSLLVGVSGYLVDLTQ